MAALPLPITLFDMLLMTKVKRNYSALFGASESL